MTFVNKTELARQYDVSVRGLPGLELALDEALPLTAGPGEIRRIPVRLKAPAAAVPAGGVEVTLVVEAQGERPARVERETRFLGPAGMPGGA
ncbi:FixG Ig-like domain-containing protein, partial [Arthrospira platensis SPKY2]